MTDDLSLLIDAAKAAGQEALAHWRNGPEVWQKPGNAGPVSAADLAVDRMLKEHLTGARPDYGWLSEESEDDGARQGRETLFIVDPIDGTRAYLAGQSSWSLSLAVVRHGQAVAGVVYLPARERLYSAALGNGAQVNGEEIRASGADRIEAARVLAAWPMLQPQMWKGGVPPFQRGFRPSIAYRLALVAHGRFDGMLTLRPSWEWDVAAGSLIAAEAGAAVSDRHGQRPVFNNPTPQIDGLLAAPPAIHRDLRARLA